MSVQFKRRKREGGEVWGGGHGGRGGGVTELISTRVPEIIRICARATAAGQPVYRRYMWRQLFL